MYGPAYGGQRIPQTFVELPTSHYIATAASFVNGRYIQLLVPVSNRQFTTPTAADIIAAIPNCSVGDTFEVFIDNQRNGNNRNMIMGTGCTLTGISSIAAGEFAYIVGLVRDTGGSVALLRS